MSTFAEYKSALCSSDEELAAVVMDRAADDYELSLMEFLDLIKLFERLFLQI